MKLTPKTPKPRVFKHGQCVLVRRPDGTVDVCDPKTSTWSTFPTERQAKWSATVFTNLATRFGHDWAPDEYTTTFIQAYTQSYPTEGDQP